MKIIFITLFPEFFASFANHSIVKRAISQKRVELIYLNLRDFGIGKTKQVDEFQYGPGPGMVLMIEPLIGALRSAQKIATGKTLSILLSARGTTLTQHNLNDWSTDYETIILISGNYEGVDERFCDYVDQEISIGNYVLTGGEIPSLTIANGIIRLLDGVIRNDSKQLESFQQPLLDYPVYTKPLIFENKKVPEILLSGHHAKIATWRNKMALKKTLKNQPQLLKKAKKSH